MGFFHTLTWLDDGILILGVLGFCFGLFHGFAKELISLLNWGVAFTLAIYVSPLLLHHFKPSGSPAHGEIVASFVAVFLAVYWIGCLIRYLMFRGGSEEGPSVFSRFLGGILGLLKVGVWMLMLLWLLVAFTSWPASETWKASVLVSPMTQCAEKIWTFSMPQAIMSEKDQKSEKNRVK